jgi:4-hydroxy-tetrahydrodipicolinate synthase
MTNGFTRRECLGVLGAAAVGTRLGAFSEPAQGRAPATKDASMRGIIVIMATPYTAAKAVDYEDLAAEVDWLYQAGVHGVMWPQNSSDYRLLTKDEIMRGMEVLAKAHTGKPGALVFGVQQDDTRAMLELAAHAEKLAPTAFIAMPPKVAKSQDDYRTYFGELAKLTSRPVLLQTVPNPPGIVFSTELILELARKHPHLGYVKEEDQPVFDRINALTAQRPGTIKRVYSAMRGRSFPYELRLGVDGTVNGCAMYADVFAKIWDAHLEGNWDKVRDLHSPILQLLNAEENIPGTGRYLLKRRGIFKTSIARRPEKPLSPTQVAEIEHHLAAMQPHLLRPLPRMTM